MSEQPALYSPRHVVILAHPGRQSFNALIADTYCEAVRRHGQEAIVRDLYRIGFDPVLKDRERRRDHDAPLSQDVEAELGILSGTDVFVFVHPIWFGMPPAMLKGYIDRVIGARVTARQLQQGRGAKLTEGKRLVSITSSSASKSWLNQQHQIDGLSTLFGRYLVHAFGMKDHSALHFGETTEGLEPMFIEPLLAQVDELAGRICRAVAEERSPRHPA